MGIEVSIIDESDYVGWAAAATRTDELYMTSVTTMVDNVLAYLRRSAPYSRVCSPSTPTSAKMSRLNILDHGNDTGVEIGTDWITVGNFAAFRGALARLSGSFDSGGFAHLQHCEAGMNLPLVEMFADTFRVPIVAGRGYHNPVYRANYGMYVRVYPAAGGSRPANDTFFWRP